MTAPTPASGAPPWAVRLDLAIGLLCLSEPERGALEAAIREAVTAAQAAQRAADAGVCEDVDGYSEDARNLCLAKAARIRASAPPAGDCVLCARDGGHACACDPQPAAEPGREVADGVCYCCREVWTTSDDPDDVGCAAGCRCREAGRRALAAPPGAGATGPR